MLGFTVPYYSEKCAVQVVCVVSCHCGCVRAMASTALPFVLTQPALSCRGRPWQRKRPRKEKHLFEGTAIFLFVVVFLAEVCCWVARSLDY